MTKGYLLNLTIDLHEQARYFRKNPTNAEKQLWQELRNRKLGGHKFRRQVAIDQFIVDFCCLENKIIIEIDGGIHFAKPEHDQIRTERLESLGFRVIRFTYDLVLMAIENIKLKILESCDQPLTPAPLPPAGEGGM